MFKLDVFLAFCIHKIFWFTGLQNDKTIVQFKDYYGGFVSIIDLIDSLCLDWFDFECYFFLLLIIFFAFTYFGCFSNFLKMPKKFHIVFSFYLNPNSRRDILIKNYSYLL